MWSQHFWDGIGVVACGAVFAWAAGAASYHLTYDVYIDTQAALARNADIGEPTVNILRSLKRDRPSANSPIARLARRQPEYAWSPWVYLTRVVTNARIVEGREYLRDKKKFFDALEEQYGVPREIVVAIWAVETNYGRTRGTFSVLRTLAQLGYRGKRRDFGRRELQAALKILHDGEVAPSAFIGSWAGASGHTQFIPTSYLAYAVDFDGDARRDIWANTEDALASTANYLREAGGWAPNEPWGFAVQLPAGFDYRRLGAPMSQTLRAWAAEGLVGVPPLPIEARLFLPGGHQGPAFLVCHNFSALLSYNNAPLYGLAVGHLADRVGGGRALAVAWPMGERVLEQKEIKELQKFLHEASFSPQHIDGLLGPLTRKAVGAYQQAYGLVPDSWPTPSLLAHLRRWRSYPRLDGAVQKPMLKSALARAFNHPIEPRPRRSDKLAVWLDARQQ